MKATPILITVTDVGGFLPEYLGTEVKVAAGHMALIACWKALAPKATALAKLEDEKICRPFADSYSFRRPKASVKINNLSRFLHTLSGEHENGAIIYKHPRSGLLVVELYNDYRE